MGHGALDEDRAHDPEQGQPCAEEGGDASDRAKGRHLTNPIYKELPNGPGHGVQNEFLNGDVKQEAGASRLSRTGE